jgi:hypothetical protein
MGNDVTWWKQKRQDGARNQNEQDPGTEIPGDTDAPDIVGRTGEEMPDVAHDEGRDRHNAKKPND